MNAAEPLPTPPSPSPVPHIVVNVGGGWWQRLSSWIAWTGFAVCLMIIFGYSTALHEYFDTTGGVQEKFFSGSRSGQDKIAIISVEGTILDESEFVKTQIDRAREDEKVKAIVVRIVSPGGTITGSDYIHHHLKKLREEKKIPLVVSMGGIAASGGYYVAMAVGDQEKSLYAEPTTTTGSIGVIIPHYDVSGLLGRFDVKEDSIVSHPRKQMLSMTRPLPEEHRKLLQAYVNEAFGRFKDIVKEGRPVFRRDDRALDQLATGEIFTATKAQDYGLIDAIGFLEDAVERAIALANLDADKTRVVKYERLPSLFNLPFLAEARTRPLDLRAVFDLNTPQAYYLATTLPVLMAQDGR